MEYSDSSRNQALWVFPISNHQPTYILNPRDAIGSKNINNRNQILQDCRDRLRSSARLMIFRGNQQKTKRVTVAINRRILLICRLFFSKRLEKNYMGQLKFLWTQKGQTNIRIDIDTSDEISPWTDETECVVANW